MQELRQILLSSAVTGSVYSDIKREHVGLFSAVRGTRHVCVVDWGAIRPLGANETADQATDELCRRLFELPEDSKA